MINSCTSELVSVLSLVKQHLLMEDGNRPVTITHSEHEVSLKRK